MIPIPILQARKNLTELKAAHLARFSRLTWRAVKANDPKVGMNTLAAAAHALDVNLIVLGAAGAGSSDFSTVAIGYKILRDGGRSWKIHCMDFVDEFRRNLDVRLLVLPPPSELAPELRALIASIVLFLCEEAQIDPPAWAANRHELAKPWFVSEIESLKATALLESPLAFRRNNIFVLSNFLSRA